MNKVYETLFYPFETGQIDQPQESQSVLFMNAALCSGLDLIKSTGLTLQQYFKPYASLLQEQGYSVSSDIPDKEGLNYILIATPKNKVETQYFLAKGLKMLRDQGMLIMAASNDAGGNRLAGFLGELGIEDLGQESKHKARVVWAKKSSAIDNNKLNEWIETGMPQDVLEKRFHSVPGIFGWNKIDKGSEILVHNLPGDMTGNGADFGCGYGYLSDHLLQHNPSIESLSCIDADFRSVEACRKNMDRQEHQAKKRYFWEDLTKPVLGLQDLDWIVMNPPFHEGKGSDISIGQSFIKTASLSLKPGGTLWMVANAGLAYERMLESDFGMCSKKFEGQGFKVYAAVK
ncbi:MAG: 16S rRNA methyltransferase [Micavibrio sp.]|nr:MAG: 16S rRNA methyltransferase [Micavibrio sp.]